LLKFIIVGRMAEANSPA